MVSLENIVSPIHIGLFVAIILLALIYSIPILFIRRFHNINNMFTANVCLATIFAGAYWLANILMENYYASNYVGNNAACVTMNYFQLMCTIQVPYALIAVYIHRLCSVVYHTKPFFRKKKWAIICISSQWAAGSVVSLVQLSSLNSDCDSPVWTGIYAFIMVVVIPSLVCLTINLIIFRYVRSSTNRVQPSSVGKQNDQPPCGNRRDLHLLRHMIIMFCIFVGGWSPVYLFSFIATQNSNYIAFICLMILAEISLLIDIIDLYLYNHDLRRYLINKIFKCH